MKAKGFESLRRSVEHGFTLVEMLIALAIFGMLTAAGVTLLTLTVRTQETSERMLGRLGEVRRAGALLTADLGQAVARVRRDRDGRPAAAFRGSSGEEALLLALVRRGWDDEETGALHSSLQRIEYRVAEGRLERLAFTHVDGEARAFAMPLFEGVRQIRLRYRDREGNWREAWDPTDPTELPRAVELVTDSDAHGQIRQLFLVGGTGR